MKDVAELAKVSPTTASYVLNNRMDVSIPDSTRERVFAAARELNFLPNATAQALSRKRSDVVALWMWIGRKPYQLQFMERFRRLVESDGFTYCVLSEHDIQKVENGTSSIYRFPLAGIIAVESDHLVAPYLAKNPEVPVVGTGIMPMSAKSHVRVDMYEAAREGIRHLYDQGCRKIVFLTFRAGYDDSLDSRNCGYADEMAELGLNADVRRVEHSDRHHEFQESVRQLFVETGVPDAVFCLSDDLSFACLCAFRKMGLRVPTDVAIMGCDGIPETQCIKPILTTVAQPYDEVCAEAWGRLRALIAMNDPDRANEEVWTRRINSTLRVGESSLWRKEI